MDLEIDAAHIDAALSRLQALLRPRVGKKMTTLVVKNMLGLLEQRAPRATVLHAIQQTIDAYARIAESGTPFPLQVARAIGDAGCLNLTALHWRMRWHKLGALAMGDDEVRAVGAHADALLPSYGDDDAEFALRVAWRCSHHFRLHLVVGRALSPNDASPTTLLYDAWQRQGARDAPDAGAPIGVVPADVGEPGVIYAHRAGFVFSPDRGDNISLDDVTGLQRFLARVPLAITPRTLAWLCHLVRIATRTPVGIAVGTGGVPAPLDVDAELLRDWEGKEQEPPSNAASLLLGIPADPVEERASLTLRAGGMTFTYARGELSFSPS